MTSHCNFDLKKEWKDGKLVSPIYYKEMDFFLLSGLAVYLGKSLEEIHGDIFIFFSSFFNFFIKFFSWQFHMYMHLYIHKHTNTLTHLAFRRPLPLTPVHPKFYQSQFFPVSLFPRSRILNFVLYLFSIIRLTCVNTELKLILEPHGVTSRCSTEATPVPPNLLQKMLQL